MNDQNDIGQKQSKLGIGMFVAGWVVLIIVATGYFSDLEHKKADPNRDALAKIEGNTVRLTLKADRDNHYIVSGKLNGEPAVFLLDTGATAVSVPDRLAESFNLQRGSQGWAFTANGRARVYDTEIKVIDIGGIQLRNIEATLSPGMDYSETILLGMSALSQLDISISNGFMTISQQLAL